jgi:redox-sensitive bicupin YhaK (pirin superfamily)
MNVSILQRSVARIDHPTEQTGMTPQHRVRRPLVPPGDPKATDPFLLLMEDWFPRGVFERHPHTGMETVTYVLEGRLDHYDNYGQQGLNLARECAMDDGGTWHYSRRTAG